MRHFSLYSEQIENIWIHADRLVMAKMLYDRGYDISELEPNDNGFLVTCTQMIFQDNAEIVEDNNPLSKEMKEKVDVPLEDFEMLLKIKPLSPTWLKMNEEQKMDMISDISFLSCDDTEKEYASFIEEDEIIIVTSCYPGPNYILIDKLMDIANELRKGENNDNEQCV